MAQIDFNPDTVPEDERDFDLIPDGIYIGQFVDSELVPTRAGDGQRLNLTGEIVEGQCARRKVWEGLNIIHPSAQAQEISQRTLKTICAAVGHIGVLSDSADLHFKPMRFRIGHEDAKGAYKAKNVIKGYEPLGGVNRPASVATSQPEPQRAPAQAAAGGASRPWK